MAIYPHPHKQLVKCLISIEYICSAYAWLTASEADRLMMSYAISQNVDAIKFIEHESVVVLNGRR